MKKWAIAGVLYVATIIGGFQIYDTWIADDKNSSAPENSHAHQKGENGTKSMEGRGSLA